MAVYERTYKPYTGPLTPEWSRFLVVPNYAFREVFQKKLLLAFFAICFVLLYFRTSIEEANLIERFGDEYRAYMLRTGRFLPRVRR